MEKILLSISEFRDAAGSLSRTGVYQEINAGRLKTIKVGRRRLIPYESAKEWLARCVREAEQTHA
jgi:excisionase family DNA binding protein